LLNTLEVAQVIEVQVQLWTHVTTWGYANSVFAVNGWLMLRGTYIWNLVFGD